jgi:hypothetical protein
MKKIRQNNQQKARSKVASMKNIDPEEVRRQVERMQAQNGVGAEGVTIEQALSTISDTNIEPIVRLEYAASVITHLAQTLAATNTRMEDFIQAAGQQITSLGADGFAAQNMFMAFVRVFTQQFIAGESDRQGLILRMNEEAEALFNHLSTPDAGISKMEFMAGCPEDEYLVKDFDGAEKQEVLDTLQDALDRGEELEEGECHSPNGCVTPHKCTGAQKCLGSEG